MISTEPMCCPAGSLAGGGPREAHRHRGVVDGLDGDVGVVVVGLVRSWLDFCDCAVRDLLPKRHDLLAGADREIGGVRDGEPVFW